MTRNTAAYESGYLARFTATIASVVPEFDPATNPIGHALAVEIFAPAVEVPVPDAPRLMAWPELAIEARARALAMRPTADVGALGEHDEDSELTGDDIFGDLVELPSAVSDVEWFEATTEPDEEAEEIDEDVRIAG
jgi:hypothetical protein